MSHDPGLDAHGEHRLLLQRAARVERIAAALAAGEMPRRAQLERELAGLRGELEQHLRREDAVLAVSPRAADLGVAHQELLDVLDFCGGSCGRDEHALLLAGRARDLVELLCGEIRREEEGMSAPGGTRSNAGATVISRLTRPFHPVELTAATLRSFALPTLASDLRTGDGYERSGVASVTLVRDPHVTLVLVALRAGATMREHEAPSAATVIVLSGRATFVSGPHEARTPVASGALVAFSADVAHSVEAIEDTTYLVVIGGRERPPSTS